jgi:hypothetical protein
MENGFRSADICVIVGVMLVSFVLSFVYLITSARVFPPFVLILAVMLGAGMVAAGLLFEHHNGHGHAAKATD